MSDKPQAAGPAPDEDDDDDYVPVQLPDPPQGEEERRAYREEREERQTQREIILDRLAAAYADLDAAREANDDGAAAQAQDRIRTLSAEQDRL